MTTCAGFRLRAFSRFDAPRSPFARAVQPVASCCHGNACTGSAAHRTRTVRHRHGAGSHDRLQSPGALHHRGTSGTEVRPATVAAADASIVLLHTICAMVVTCAASPACEIAPRFRALCTVIGLSRPADGSQPLNRASMDHLASGNRQHQRKTPGSILQAFLLMMPICESCTDLSQDEF